MEKNLGKEMLYKGWVQGAERKRVYGGGGWGWGVGER